MGRFTTSGAESTSELEAGAEEESARILVLDDHPIARIGIACLLRARPGLLIEGLPGWSAAGDVLPSPDLIILSSPRDASHGLAQLRDIRRTLGVTPILVLLSAPTCHEREALVAAGAQRVVDRRVHGDELRREVMSLVAPSRCP